MNKAKKQNQKNFLNFLRGRADEETAGMDNLILQAEKAVTHIMTGGHYQRKAGTGEKFWQYREYDPSDRPQDIDWRQSAKGDRVFIRQKEWQTTQTALIWCQSNQSMNYSSDKNLPTKQETAHVLALAFGLLLSRGGELVSLMESHARPGRTEHTLQNMTHQLQFLQTAPLPQPDKCHIPKNSSLILIGDFLSPIEEIAIVFSQLAASATHAIVVQTLDPAELELPFSGRIIFTQRAPSEEGEQHTREQIENVSDIRDEYKARMTTHLEQIRELCRSHQWDYILHNSQSLVRETLNKVVMVAERPRK